MIKLEKMDDFFASRIDGYDAHMKRDIEGASGFYAYTASRLPSAEGSRVLDLGCGTGLELEEYFAVNPGATVTGIDLSEAMLNVLKAKFPGKNLALIHASYFDVPFGNGQYDAAVSVESLHHFPAAMKAALYEKLCSALTENGVFVLTDYFAESEEMEKEYFQNLAALKKEQGLSDDVFYHYDTPLTVGHEMDVLSRAGFRDVRIMKQWGESTYTVLAHKTDAMEKATRKYLAKVAGEAAQIPFHGFIEGKGSNLEPIIRFFPKWTLTEADGSWCAAFVYYCCREAGFEIPIRPDGSKTCHLAGCIAWEEFAMSDPRITYDKGGEGFVPEAGDIVLYDRIFENKEHDHIGIVIEDRVGTILTAEGNLNNTSGIIERPKDKHIRGYIRIPDGYRYQRISMDHRTESLLLHFVTEDDLPEVARTWPSDHHPLSDGEAREVIASMRRNYGKNAKGSIRHLCLAVCGKDRPGIVMGWCGLDGSRDPTEPEIFILLDEAYRNQGYGTQCVKELLRIAVEDYAVLRVHGGCAKENIASARAMEKGGMVQYGMEQKR